MGVVLTSNAVYQPFSFNELLKPLAMYTEEYRNIEQGIADLESKSELIKRYAMEDPNSEAAKLYTEYANNLDRQAEALAKYGMPAVNRKNLYNLVSQYSSNIVPIEQAITKRAEDIKKQQEGRVKDNTIFYSRDASLTSLDDYIKNPELSYSMYSGNTLAGQVAQQVQGFANKLMDMSVSKTSDPYVNAFLERYGYTMGEVREALTNPQSGKLSGVLNNIVNEVVSSSGINSWDNWNDIKNDVIYHAGRGLSAGIGKDNLSFREDYGAKRAAMRADEIWRRSLPDRIPNSNISNTTYSGSSEGIESEEEGINVGRVSWNPNTNTYESSKLKEVRDRNKEYVSKNQPRYTYDPRFGINQYDLKWENYNKEEQKITQELEKIKNNNSIALAILGNNGGKLFEFETKKYNDRLGRQEILDPENKNNKAFIDRTKKDIYSSILTSANHFFDPNTGEPVIPSVDTKKSPDNIHLKIFADPKTNKILTEINGQIVEYKGTENFESANILMREELDMFDFSDITLNGTSYTINNNIEDFKRLDEKTTSNILLEAVKETNSPIIHLIFNDDILKIDFNTNRRQTLSNTINDPSRYSKHFKDTAIKVFNNIE